MKNIFLILLSIALIGVSIFAYLQRERSLLYLEQAEQQKTRAIEQEIRATETEQEAFQLLEVAQQQMDSLQMKLEDCRLNQVFSRQ